MTASVKSYRAMQHALNSIGLAKRRSLNIALIYGNDTAAPRREFANTVNQIGIEGGGDNLCLLDIRTFLSDIMRQARDVMQ